MLLKVERKKNRGFLVAMIKCDATVRRIFSGGRRGKSSQNQASFTAVIPIKRREWE